MNDRSKIGSSTCGQRVMHDAVAVRGGADQPFLRFVDVERAVGAGPIGLVGQFLGAAATAPRSRSK